VGIPETVTRLNGLLPFGARLELWKGLSVVVRLGRVESSDRRDDSDLITAGLSVAVPDTSVGSHVADARAAEK
jgi:hypothetical protein